MKIIITKFTILLLLFSSAIFGQTGLIVETVNTAEVATFQCTNNSITQVDFLGNYALNGSGANAFKRGYIQADIQNFRIGLSNNNINGSVILANNDGDRLIVQNDGDVSVTGYLNVSDSGNTGSNGDIRYQNGSFEGFGNTGWEKFNAKNYAFIVRNSNTITLSNFNWVQITSYVEDLDANNVFDDSTGEFTAPVAGIYHFDTKLSLTRNNMDLTQIPFIVRLLVNGSVIKAHGQLTNRITLQSAYGQDINFGTTIELNAGDTVTLNVNAVTGGAGLVDIKFNNSTSDSSFSGYLISEN